jgi:hypothetical protein
VVATVERRCLVPCAVGGTSTGVGVVAAYLVLQFSLMGVGVPQFARLPASRWPTSLAHEHVVDRWSRALAAHLLHPLPH